MLLSFSKNKHLIMQNVNMYSVLSKTKLIYLLSYRCYCIMKIPEHAVDFFRTSFFCDIQRPDLSVQNLGSSVGKSATVFIACLQFKHTRDMYKMKRRPTSYTQLSFLL